MPIKRLYLIIAAFLCAACLFTAAPAKADWDHHHHHGYWHDGVWLDFPGYYPGYYYPPAPVYYYPPPRPAYYYPPAYYSYPGYYEPAPAYFMGVPLYGLGVGLNIHIR